MATSGNKTKLKIGLVLDDGLDKPDGVQQYILSIGEWLAHEGHDVHYLVGETERRDIPKVHSLSRNIKAYGNGNRMSNPLPTSRRKLREFLEAEKFDVLHVQTPYSPFMGEQLITLASPQTAVVGTFHILPVSKLFGFGVWLYGLWCRHSLRRFDAMLSVSPAAASFAKKTFRIDSEVLPNVIDYPRFAQAKPLPAYQDKKLTILFLGRLVPRKGSELLVEAIAQLAVRRDLPKFRVLICGRGPLEAKLRAKIETYGLQDTIEMVGFVTEADKPRYYASADIAVFPSSGGESFGIVLLEAMANGRSAVLAGDNPGYRSVMESQPDLLFNPRDASVLADKLASYLTDKSQRHKMAEWGGEYVKDFDVAVVGQRLLSVYREALRKRRKL